MTYFSHENPITVANVKNRVDKNGRVVFNIAISFTKLVYCDGIDCLNEYLDDCVEGGEGYLLEDIYYEPIGAHDGYIILEVTANATSFLSESI